MLTYTNVTFLWVIQWNETLFRITFAFNINVWISVTKYIFIVVWLCSSIEFLIKFSHFAVYKACLLFTQNNIDLFPRYGEYGEIIVASGCKHPCRYLRLIFSQSSCIVIGDNMYQYRPFGATTISAVNFDTNYCKNMLPI